MADSDVVHSMTHDPLCVELYGQLLPTGNCVACGIIARVRKDQTRRCIAAVDDYFDRGEYSPAQLMDDLYALLSSDSAPDPASTDEP
jgi:hypothetical protein